VPGSPAGTFGRYGWAEEIPGRSSALTGWEARARSRQTNEASANASMTSGTANPENRANSRETQRLESPMQTIWKLFMTADLEK